ncbi:hypothetical protein AMATHDRAFT_183891 [Amanita thiersii Skay4041]|uniref:RhoGAP-domain-containing protein n=1 Tax=Amanita thiersii Skay4041 TaxID=703135 RepID=A0A2A9N9X8_9AGAR|nr:hypothetical protein AMATHDRAFT_183891 [Amanita thiersii Skay4041]
MASDILLKIHSAAPDPKLAALEQAISERNSLSSQNTQLWKLIEKQRAGYNQLLKELERIRAERDAYRAKLGITGTPNKRDRTYKSSVPQPRNERSPEVAFPDLSSSTPASSHPPTKSPLVTIPGSVIAPPRLESLSLTSERPNKTDPTRSNDRASPTYIHESSRSYNSPNTPLTSQSTVHRDSLTPTISDPPNDISVSNTSYPAVHMCQRSSTSTITHSLQNYLLHDANGHGANLVPHELHPSVVTPSLSIPATNITFSRDSRISLPDEAKQYIASMSDSPMSSPHVDAFTPSLKHKTSLASGTSGSPTLLTSSSALSGDESRQTEFLYLDDEDEDDAERGLDNDLAGAGHEHPVSYQGLDSDELQSASSLDALTYHLEQGNQTSVHAAVEDFPLPPTNVLFYPHPMTNIQERISNHNVHPQSFSESTFQTTIYAPNNQSSNQQQKSNESLTPFRALPLLPVDLPTTKIIVSHSFVRPNDRGKEVLSFVVHVSPGNGKPGWRVEKMYSDVLNLDHRVRLSVGKGVGKKIGNLPEGKLWKDHAPAKVDQRKATLEHYLQTLINLPVKNNDEVIAFFTSDIVREAKQPVMQTGHKEGYLTKRGKNFGGWKTRYFVLQGPILEYYDCRGGTHLGSITIAGAQIGRQQRNDRIGVDDDKEYRHAFLIVEAKKGPGGNHPRHVLCAESDEDRDNWVEMLVRYFTGTYSETHPPVVSAAAAVVQPPSQSHTSASLGESHTTFRTKVPTRGFSRDDISISKGSAVPISQLAPDGNNAKFFQAAPSNVEDCSARPSSPGISFDNSSNEGPQHTCADPLNATELSIASPSSLPEPSTFSVTTMNSSPLESTPGNAILPAPRANSELGHYPDLQQRSVFTGLKSPRRHSPEKHRSSPRDTDRKSLYPSGLTTSVLHSTVDRVPSPDKLDSSNRVKISGPMNGAPIPSGFKFGGHSDTGISSSDRREKAKSRSFWGFGKAVGDKQMIPNVPRAVFGVPLEESLEVAQICNLPAIVFRSIQYLEAKEADQEEGIYRLSGSSAVIKSLKDRFNLEGDVDLLASDEYWDPHAIAGLLKSYLRELPSSILTRDLHLKFLAVIDFVDAQERIRELSHLIAALPLANYTLLRALTAHLILIVQNSTLNKMTMRNVGIVFSPTLGIPAGVFSLMLGEFNRVFNVEVDGTDTNDADAPSEISTELYRRNSRRYSEAAADQLLGLTGRSLKASPSDEAQSDGEDFSVQDGESEVTDGDATVDSFSSSSLVANTLPQVEQLMHYTPPDTPTAAKVSKASNVAVSRGLNVSLSQSERRNRYSRMINLPTSPRPPHSPQILNLSHTPDPCTL